MGSDDKPDGVFRRKFLFAAAGTASVTGTAGCLDSSSDEDTGDTTSSDTDQNGTSDNDGNQRDEGEEEFSPEVDFSVEQDNAIVGESFDISANVTGQKVEDYNLTLSREGQEEEIDLGEGARLSLEDHGDYELRAVVSGEDGEEAQFSDTLEVDQRILEFLDDGEEIVSIDESNISEEIDYSSPEEVQEITMEKLLEEESDWQRFIESIDEDSELIDAKDHAGTGPYPVREDAEGGFNTNYDRFWYRVDGVNGFARSDNVGEALDWLHNFVAEWDWHTGFRNSDTPVEELMGEDGLLDESHIGHEKLKDEYAAIIQHAINEFTDNAVEAVPHVMWEDPDVGDYFDDQIIQYEDEEYGQIIAWDKENNETFLVEPYKHKFAPEQTNLLKILYGQEDNIGAPSWNDSRNHHPKVFNSCYVPELLEGPLSEVSSDDPGVERWANKVSAINTDSLNNVTWDENEVPGGEYFHPLRPESGRPEKMDEEIHDEYLIEMFANFSSDELYEEVDSFDNITISPEYKNSLRKAISDPGARHRAGNEAEFSQVYRQSAVFNQLLEKENDYEIKGTVWEPKFVEKWS
jgi:hypothetical protein